MPRKLKESDLSDKAARRRLPTGLHWRKISIDIHLGFKKHANGEGVWLVRWYKGNQKYWQYEFAIVEGIQEKDDVRVLDYAQACRWAVVHVDGAKAKYVAEMVGPAETVRSAVNAYVDGLIKRQVEKGVSRPDGDGGALKKHVLSDKQLASLPLYQLESDHLSDWKELLEKTPLENGKRRSASSVQKITTYFKAALNQAAVKHRKKLPRDFQIRIQDGLGSSQSFAPVARHGQALKQHETIRLLTAAKEIDAEVEMDGDLYRLTLAKAATGTRFSQLARVTVGDLQPHNNRLMIPVSLKGTGEKTITHVGFPLEQPVLNELMPLIEGRGSSERLFERWYHTHRYIDGKRVKLRTHRGPWNTSSNFTRYWNRIVERANLAGKSADIVAYALRHTSIVRMLRERLPLTYVAALHDTSEKSIRQHYAAEIVDALSELAAAAAFKMDDGKSPAAPA